MVEQFFDSHIDHEAFEDYEVRQVWAQDKVEGCKFVWAMWEGVSISLLCLAR